MIWQIASPGLVTEFAKIIGCDWVGTVKVIPDLSCNENMCHDNVRRYILSHGGERVLGYYILDSIWGYQAITHSVWRSPTNELVDITPFSDLRSYNTFASLKDNTKKIDADNIYSHTLAKYQLQDYENMYYVYALVDPGSNAPFYIGKGKGRRVKTLFWETPETRNQHKENKIAAIRAGGFEPEIHYIAENIIDEAYAYKIEEDLIAKLGRKDTSHMAY